MTEISIPDPWNTFDGILKPDLNRYGLAYLEDGIYMSQPATEWFTAARLGHFAARYEFREKHNAATRPIPRGLANFPMFSIGDSHEEDGESGGS